MTILENGKQQMEQNLESDPDTISELYRNLVPVGQRSFFVGTVTEQGKQYGSGVQNLLRYLEDSTEFNNIPGVSSRESPLQENQNVERAKLGLETEILRSEKAIEVLQNELRRREGR